MLGERASMAACVRRSARPGHALVPAASLIDRRKLVQAMAAAGVVLPRIARGQPSRGRAGVGYLTPTRRETGRAVLEPFLEGLRKRGFVDGRTMTLDARFAEDDVARLPALADELVKARPDVIVAASPVAILAAARATRSIPVVMAFWGGEGLVESGLVASFARPGGNVTGVYMLADELEGKRLELILQTLPKARRIGVLGMRKDDTPAREVAGVARAANVELVMSDPPGGAGYDGAFASLVRARVDGAMVPSSPRFALDYRQVVAAAATHRLPAIYEWGYMAQAGGLMAYGPSIVELQERVADYTARILRGASPAGLPVEQPTTFELVINTVTAKALGLAVPQSMLLRANELVR